MQNEPMGDGTQRSTGLPPEAVHEFRQIWKEEYGEDIPYDEAKGRAKRFLRICRRMLVIPQEESDDDPT